MADVVRRRISNVPTFAEAWFLARMKELTEAWWPNHPAYAREAMLNIRWATTMAFEVEARRQLEAQEEERARARAEAALAMLRRKANKPLPLKPITKAAQKRHEKAMERGNVKRKRTLARFFREKARAKRKALTTKIKEAQEARKQARQAEEIKT